MVLGRPASPAHSFIEGGRRGDDQTPKKKDSEERGCRRRRGRGGRSCSPLAAGRRSAQDPANGLLYRSYSAAGEIVAGGRKKRWAGRRVVAIAAISLAGGMALSGINDLAIFHGCTRKAIETATENRDVVEAIGVPILRGPWYDASVVLGHRRRSVSCTFPVTGPLGSGLFQIEAVRSGEDGMLSFLRHHDWEIRVMDAHLEVASDDDKLKKVTINLVSGSDQSSGGECKAES